MSRKYDGLSNDEVIEEYGKFQRAFTEELKKRGIIRTINLVGELGEYKAIDFYNKSPQLPNLKAVGVGTKMVDALDENGKRYSIKATRYAGTGVFNGLKDVDMDLLPEQVLDYVVIVKFTEYLSVEAIYELDWNTFVSLKKWNGGKRTWYLNITEELKRKAKILYNTDSDMAM
ncbi:hypothetical protein CON34_22115 [Bacillus thuringiensis]|uniref:hypothetical protein n=1 Tax=Bacillus thuringiensis TaxID=1428 RepID=UPI000BEB3880|nr:hypothetical protein [Bacillus thuringiensis]MED4447221.1 hypothetical protein [Bacillus cereus]PEB46343.1 hypothetical protein COM82_17665 [Bacillus thuringiensis]PED24226.1 hypothetical protein CON34_22115 [Bacillus thuringiensis]